jgi:nitric oxide dioxygenase
MAIAAEQAGLIRDSFHALRERLAPASEAFYEALFARAPELRQMFRDDLAGQGMKFMTTLGTVLGAVADEPEAVARLAELGRGHALIGVRAEHFAPMGEALIETLAGELGGDFTPALEAAWRAAYADIAARIIAAGRIG